MDRLVLDAALRACDVIVRFAVAGQWDKCAAKYRELLARFGPQSVGVLLTYCADVQLHHQGVTRDESLTVQPVWVDMATGEVRDADQVDNEAAVWAGRFTAARARNDRATAQALLRTTGSAEQSVARLSAVLCMTAHIVRQAQQEGVSVIERCECCDLPVGSCGKAAEQKQRQHDQAHRRWLIGRGWYEAQYPLTCCGCGERRYPPILIKRDGFGDLCDYRASCCAPDLPEGV